MNPVSIGVVGAGLFGRKHIDTMRLEPMGRLTGIADPTPEAAAYASKIGVPCFASYTEMLVRARPEAAIIATPNVLHVPAGLACAERGPHVGGEAAGGYGRGGHAAR
jgi:predicted dehydrogenase